MTDKRKLLFLVGVLACQAGTPSGAMVRDSSGATVIELAAARSVAVDRLALVPEPFEQPLPEFGDILDVGLAPDGRIVVLDAFGPSLVVLDRDGRELGRFGSAGSGPGQLGATGLSALVVIGDTVLVPDLVNLRVTRFGLDGQVLGSYAIDVDEGLPVDWRRGAAGELVFRRHGVPLRIARLGAAGVVTDGPATIPGEPLLPAAGPLSPLPLWCVTPGGRVVVGRTDEFLFTLSGEPQHTRSAAGRSPPASTGDESTIARFGVETLIRRALPDRPLSEGAVAHLEELMRRSMTRRSGGEIDPALMAGMIASVTLPDVAPQVAGLACPDDESIWVQLARPVESMGEEALRVGSASGLGANVWEAIDLRSGLVRRVDLPEHSRVTRVTRSVVLAITTDQLDRESVARWRHR